MSEPTGAVPAANIEALKRLKEVETQCDAKIAQVKAEVTTRVAVARDAAEKAVQAARVEMERMRDQRLTEARAAAQSESEKILAEGKSSADAAAKARARTGPSARSKLLDAVIGEFRGGDTGGK